MSKRLRYNIRQQDVSKNKIIRKRLHMVSLEKIAEMMEVSVSTISRALAGKQGVSESKKQKIIEIARQLGYEPNIQASMLRTGKGRGLAIITYAGQTEISSYRNALLCAEGKKVFGLVHAFLLTSDDNINTTIQRILAEKYQAVIISGGSSGISTESINALKARKIPLTTIDSACDGADNVLIDRATGTYQAARMLLLTGCKHPVFYIGSNSLDNDPRVMGIRKAFKSLGRDEKEIQFLPVKYGGNYEGGYRLTQELLNTMHTDGIFCYNDTTAIGAMRALSKAGVKIPEQIKIIGFDNVPASEYLPVSLTTAAQPVEELVGEALKLTSERLENYDRELKSVSFPVKLIVRESAPVNEYELREKIFETHN